jgi:hypothetical protein
MSHSKPQDLEPVPLQNFMEMLVPDPDPFIKNMNPPPCL